MRRQLPIDNGTLIVILLAPGFAIVFGLVSLRLLASFSMNGYDLTNMSWNTAHGRPLVFCYAYSITHRLGVHIEPIFLLISPLSLAVNLLSNRLSQIRAGEFHYPTQVKFGSDLVFRGKVSIR